MSVSLQKGQKVNLSKEHAGLAKVIVGLGWDEAKPSADLRSVFLPDLLSSGKRSILLFLLSFFLP